MGISARKVWAWVGRPIFVYVIPLILTGAVLTICALFEAIISQPEAWKTLWFWVLLVGGVLVLGVQGAWPGVYRRWLRKLVSSRARDEAFRTVLTQVVQILGATDSGDPGRPILRATILLPERRGSEERLYPRFRITSIPGAQVLEHGEDDFKTSTSFAKNEALAGRTWCTCAEGYLPDLKTVTDCDGDDETRTKAWIDQWTKRGAKAPEQWSMYMRFVRTVWTFAIPNPDGKTALAVVSLDSTRKAAFGPSAGGDGAGSLIQHLRPRDALAAAVAGIALTALSPAGTAEATLARSTRSRPETDDRDGEQKEASSVPLQLTAASATAPTEPSTALAKKSSKPRRGRKSKQ